jgi:hypothetical protein
MQKRPVKVRIIVLLAMSALLMGAFFIAPGPAKGQGGWSHDFDFTTSDWAFVPEHNSNFTPADFGSWQSGVGWQAVNASNHVTGIDHYTLARIGVGWSLAGPRTITEFSIVYDLTQGTWNVGNCPGAGCTYYPTQITADVGIVASAASLPDTSGTNKTISWTGSLANVQGIAVDLEAAYFADNFGSGSYGSGVIKSLHIAGLGTDPFEEAGLFTPTPTPTATFTATPPYYTPQPITTLTADSPTCMTPDTRSASFLTGQQWAFNGGANYAVPLPQRFLRLPPGGSASMSVNLSDAEYKLQVVYQSSGIGGGSFVASVGGQPYTIQPADSAEHTFETEPIRYATGATTLGLSKPATDSVDVVIKFFCLSAVQGSGSGAITTGGDKNDQCETCDPPISITDIPGILNWLLCNIRRLWTCYLLPILTNILSFIGTIIKFILSFFGWIVRGIGDILNWVAGLISSAWGSITGWISNLFAGVNNDFHSSGIADDMNVAASRTRDLPTAIGNGISTLGGQLSQIFTNTGQGLGGFIDFIWRLINFGASAIAYVIGLIPLVIQSFVDGINSASTPPSGSPLCSNPASLAYYPCLGFYVLDNTIFAGPAGYLFPVLIGIIVFYNLVWIFTRIKEELSK